LPPDFKPAGFQCPPDFNTCRLSGESGINRKQLQLFPSTTLLAWGWWQRMKEAFEMD